MSPSPQLDSPLDRLCHFVAAPRRLVEMLILLVLLLLLLQGFVVETYEVPTGSMAPAILGRHRCVTCPSCGLTVRVGRGSAESDDLRRRHDQRAACPNCGCAELGLLEARETRGDRLLVNKLGFELRRPRRWELVVFRLFGIVFVKRIVALPGEEIEIKDGDIHIDGAIARKPFDLMRAMRILVFDNNHQPQPDAWHQRWEVSADYRGAHPLIDTEIQLASDGTGLAEVTYHHFQRDRSQSQAICDEYAYNGGVPLPLVSVHDYLFACQLEVTRGAGKVCLSLTDGQDRVLVELPVANRTNGEKEPAAARLFVGGKPHAEASVSLTTGKRYNVEMAFVDRRVVLAIDGATVISVDLPAATQRAAVSRPVTLGVHDAGIVVRDFRLYRDVHYTQSGSNAVGGQGVRLGPEQYFVLGDNSSASADSRHWSEQQGAISSQSLIGKPLRVPWLR
jgi:signal peptidase I